MKKTWGDRVFDLANAVIMVFVCVVIAYPLYYVLIASFTDPTIVNSGKVLLYPEKIFMGGYQKIFEYVLCGQDMPIRFFIRQAEPLRR